MSELIQTNLILQAKSQKYFSKRSKFIDECPFFSRCEKMVIHTLFDYVKNQEGWDTTSPSLRNISARTAYSTRAISYALLSLKNRGFVEIIGRQSQSLTNIYIIGKNFRFLLDMWIDNPKVFKALRSKHHFRPFSKKTALPIDMEVLFRSIFNGPLPSANFADLPHEIFASHISSYPKKTKDKDTKIIFEDSKINNLEKNFLNEEIKSEEYREEERDEEGLFDFKTIEDRNQYFESLTKEQKIQFEQYEAFKEIRKRIGDVPKFEAPKTNYKYSVELLMPMFRFPIVVKAQTSRALKESIREASAAFFDAVEKSPDTLKIMADLSKWTEMSVRNSRALMIKGLVKKKTRQTEKERRRSISVEDAFWKKRGIGDDVSEFNDKIKERRSQGLDTSTLRKSLKKVQKISQSQKMLSVIIDVMKENGFDTKFVEITNVYDLKCLENMIVNVGYERVEKMMRMVLSNWDSVCSYDETLDMPTVYALTADFRYQNWLEYSDADLVIPKFKFQQQKEDRVEKSSLSIKTASRVGDLKNEDHKLKLNTDFLKIDHVNKMVSMKPDILAVNPEELLMDDGEDDFETVGDDPVFEDDDERN